MDSAVDYQIQVHLNALSDHYAERFDAMKFSAPYVDPKDKDSVISVSKKICYAVILRGEFLNRL